MTSMLGAVHGRWVHRRRIAILAHRLALLIPRNASVVDIGCGDGKLAAYLLTIRPDLIIRGFEIQVRADTAIPVEPFDGDVLSCDDRSTDIAMLVDVLHHTPDPRILLKEAARVARHSVLLKDHLLQGWLAGPTLRLMDWAGNAHHAVHLPYNYWTLEQWHGCFRQLGLSVDTWETRVLLYPWPASLVFDRSLHVVASLSRVSDEGA